VTAGVHLQIDFIFFFTFLYHLLSARTALQAFGYIRWYQFNHYISAVMQTEKFLLRRCFPAILFSGMVRQSKSMRKKMFNVAVDNLQFNSTGRLADCPTLDGEIKIFDFVQQKLFSRSFLLIYWHAFRLFSLPTVYLFNVRVDCTKPVLTWPSGCKNFWMRFCDHACW